LRKSIISLAPLALVAAVGTAFADESSVTLYGVVDVGVGNIEHSANFDPNFGSGIVPINQKSTSGGTSAKSATGMFNGGLSADRWGLRGQEDLGGGMKAIFNVESAFSITNGTVSNAAQSLAHNTAAGPNISSDSAVSGQLFSRAANAGLSGDFGTVTFGRNVSFFVENIAQFDPQSAAQLFSPIGFSGSIGGGGGYTDNTRVDSSIKYRKSVGDFTLGALYKVSGISGSIRAQSATQLNVVYTHGAFAGTFGYEKYKDAFSVANAASAVPGNAAVGTVSATAADSTDWMLGARYKLNDATTVKAGFQRITYNNPSNPGVDVTVNNIFGVNLSGAPTINPFYTAKRLNVWWAGVSRDVTSALNVSAAAYHQGQNQYQKGGPNIFGQSATIGSCTAGGSSSALCAGGANYTSLVADYRLSKRSDLYAGWMKSRVSGGLSNGFVDNTNRIIGAGMRHTF
jgi:GBP family porin